MFFLSKDLPGLKGSWISLLPCHPFGPDSDPPLKLLSFPKMNSTVPWIIMAAHDCVLNVF